MKTIKNLKALFILIGFTKPLKKVYCTFYVYSKFHANIS